MTDTFSICFQTNQVLPASPRWPLSRRTPWQSPGTSPATTAVSPSSTTSSRWDPRESTSGPGSTSLTRSSRRPTSPNSSRRRPPTSSESPPRIRSAPDNHHRPLNLPNMVSAENQLTVPMLRLFSSKAQECKYFWKPLKPCHVGTHLKALAEYSHMSSHLLGFRSFFVCFFIILYWSN